MGEAIEAGHKLVPKQWGTETWYVNNEMYCCKKLVVTPGFSCSRHLHAIKDETFFVLFGAGYIQIEDQVHRVRYGDRIRIRPGTWHSFASEKGMEILEVSTHHEDADVERDPGYPSRKLTDEEWLSLKGEN